jgi:zinc protease
MTGNSKSGLRTGRIAIAAFAAMAVCTLCRATETSSTVETEKPSKTYEALKGHERVSFLPDSVVDSSVSPTLQRAGITIPLRPEMLVSEATTFTVPSVSQTTFSNGLVYYFLESHDLPSVNVTIMIRAGSQLDRAGMVGLADVTAQTLRAGGSVSRTGDEIDREMEELGSSLDVSVEREFVVFHLFCLVANRERSVSLLSDILLHPRFDPAKLDKQKDLKIESIRRQNDQAADISRREFRKLIYGREHPLARTSRVPDIVAIKRSSVQGFYDDYYRPSSMAVGLSGDLKPEEARQLVESAFGNWNRPPAHLPAPVGCDDSLDTVPAVWHIHKQTAQANIRVGHLGMPRFSPDKYAVDVMNAAYGTGGFSSRLMQEVRTKRGYAYGVGGGVMSDDPAGLFVAAASSKSGTTGAAIKTILEVTRQLLSEGVTADEIETSKRDIIHSFITNFDTPNKTVYQHMYYDFLGYPADYLDTYLGRIRAVTRDQVGTVAHKYIHPERLKILTVGNEKAFDMPLQTFGKVGSIELEPFMAPVKDPAGEQ